MVAGGKGGRGDWEGREYISKLNIYIFLKRKGSCSTDVDVQGKEKIT